MRTRPWLLTCSLLAGCVAGQVGDGADTSSNSAALGDDARCDAIDIPAPLPFEKWDGSPLYRNASPEVVTVIVRSEQDPARIRAFAVAVDSRKILFQIDAARLDLGAF